MQNNFVHLHVHTEYSIADGIVRIPELIRAVADAGMPAVALTDLGNLFAMVKFYRAALAAGVKPIIGADLRLYNPDDGAQPWRLTLLCQDQAGYGNLTRLVTRTYLEGQVNGIPMLRKEWLEGATDGLIALSGGREGEVGQALLKQGLDAGQACLRSWLALFPDRFYLAVARTGREGEEAHVAGTVQLAQRECVPLVATNEVCFVKRDEFDAHEARVCIHEGRTLHDPRRPRRYSAEQYLRTPQEMSERFADLPEVLENTVELARRCNLTLELGAYALPDFPVPAGKDLAAHLRDEARNGLASRLKDDGVPEVQHEEYRARLDMELETIIQMGFPGYFLIVADFIRWGKGDGIPVGPGRGSGAGSLVAYALGITNLDPIRHELLFERFLNPERVSMPDFDIDFCMERRDEVIDYVAERYGRDRVSQIITYGSMAARAVVRDVGRVLGHPYGYVDRIAKLIPGDLGMTLKRALEESEDLKARYDEEEEVQTLIDMALALEGCVRNAGKHAGGVVIAPSPLIDFTPLYAEPGGDSVVTQFDKDDVEAVGLVKFDFLGLRTLTIIDWAVDAVNEWRREAGEPEIDIDQIPMDDPGVFKLLGRCATTAVFQLESRGMKDLIKRLQPDCFEEITALVALFRPGPLQSGMVDDFINRKHGRARVAYPHADLEPILKPTYGVILYQEQVMQIAQTLAGYTLGGADLLRRAMGKKKPEEMAKQREIFVGGARDRGVAEATATHIFDLIEKFAGYGFNKSHSAAYALVAYQTAWLKVHYPSAFMAAVLSADMDNTDKVVTFIDDCRAGGLTVEPPDVNESAYRFRALDGQRIRYGLGAVKGVGRSAIEAILAAREAGGAFRDLFDFCSRVDLQRANRRVIEALIKAGALDGLGPHRAALAGSLDQALHRAEQESRNRSTGQDDLFGAITDTVEDLPKARFGATPAWTEAERLSQEKETLGLYLTGHPIRAYRMDLVGAGVIRIGDLQPDKGAVWTAGLCHAIRMRQTRRGDRAAFVTLDDQSGRIEVALFGEVFQANRHRLVKDELLIVRGTVALDEYAGGCRMTAEEVLEVEALRTQCGDSLEVLLASEVVPEAAALGAVLGEHQGDGLPVRCLYRQGRTEACLRLGPMWQVRPRDELLLALERLPGVESVRIRYAAGASSGRGPQPSQRAAERRYEPELS